MRRYVWNRWHQFGSRTRNEKTNYYNKMIFRSPKSGRIRLAVGPRSRLCTPRATLIITPKTLKVILHASTHYSIYLSVLPHHATILAPLPPYLPLNGSFFEGSVPQLRWAPTHIPSDVIKGSGWNGHDSFWRRPPSVSARSDLSFLFFMFHIYLFHLAVNIKCISISALRGEQERKCSRSPPPPCPHPTHNH